MYCRNCGAEIDGGAYACVRCGHIQQPGEAVDSGGLGWGIIGFLIPIVGLFLFLIWKDSKPKTAKAVVIGVLLNILIAICLVAAFLYFSVTFLQELGFYYLEI